MNEVLAAALQHAMPRIQMNDIPYATRMAISHIIRDSVLEETGYGIYAMDPKDQSDLESPITIDFLDGTVGNGEDWHSFTDFIRYHTDGLLAKV